MEAPRVLKEAAGFFLGGMIWGSLEAMILVEAAGLFLGGMILGGGLLGRDLGVPECRGKILGASWEAEAPGMLEP